MKKETKDYIDSVFVIIVFVMALISPFLFWLGEKYGLSLIHWVYLSCLIIITTITFGINHKYEKEKNDKMP